MKVAVQVPVKWRQSERCKGKNFRELGGVPLAARKFDELIRLAPADWQIWLDTESVISTWQPIWDNLSAEAKERLGSMAWLTNNRVMHHARHPVYAEDWANGNHLLTQFVCAHPEYDVYVQAFVTAPFLKVSTIVDMVETIVEAREDGDRIGLPYVIDSALTVVKQQDFIWNDNAPVNYDHRRLDGFGRTQDMQTMRETTGVYVVMGDVARRTGCRVGANPMLWQVNAREAFDVDTEDDFAQAERMVREEKEYV